MIASDSEVHAVRSAAEAAAIVGSVARMVEEAATDAKRSPAALAQALDRLREIPTEFVDDAAIDLLLRIASSLFYASLATQAIEPAQLAEQAARQRSDGGRLRRALMLRGLALIDTSNLPEATACLGEALEIAQRLGDLRAECMVWNNLGLLLMYASLTSEAIACCERANELATASDAPQDLRGAALANAAFAALREQNYAAAYRLCLRALDESPEPATPQQHYFRAGVESAFARTLLGLGDVRKARRHAVLAREFAAVSQIPRAELDSEIALGLTEVESNTVDIGLSRIKRMTEFSRAKVPAHLTETLAAAVAAYERAGQPDVALVYLHELLALNKQSKATQLLMHHQRHVAALRRKEPAEIDAVENRLRWQQGTLRGKLALDERDRIRNLGQLVEQQALAAERLDDTTGEHCYRVGRLASLLGREVGLEDDVCFLIDLAARLHDIGKLIVPDAVLLKPGKLTPGERAIMETHTVAGWEILGQTDIPQMHIAQEIARHHHERWDGTGYPDRLRGNAIPIAARVSALADVFDALTHKRPYKDAWPVADALAEISRLSGRQFDAEITDVFLALVPRLQREHADLDRFLAEEARHSPFIQAREKIARALKGHNPEVSVFELRR